MNQLSVGVARRIVAQLLTLGAALLPMGWAGVAAAQSNSLVISSVSISESNLVISGSGGLAGAIYYVLASTDITVSPVTLWDSIATNTFATDGTFTNSIPLDLTIPQEFFVITTAFNIPDQESPSAPENLTATAVSSNEIDLGWLSSTDNVAVTGYLMERQDPGSTNFVQIGSTTGTNYSDLGLAANTAYSYRVRATDAAVNLGPYSSVASATTFPAMVAAAFTGSPASGAAPLTVTFTDTSSGTITNRCWNFGDGATSNTTATSVLHLYTVVGTNTVNLTVSGPVGADTLTRTNYIVVLNPAQLVVNPGSLSFGSVTIGQTNSLSFSVINTGDAPLSGTATGAAPFLVTSGGSYNVTGGQTQTVSVAFAPGSNATFNGSVIFSSNGGVSTNAVSGVGLSPGSIAVTPATWDFGTLATGTTAQTSFTVTNSGGTAVSNGTASVNAPYTIVSGATFSVPDFGATNVTVQFAPVGAGAFTNAVIFATANGGNATNTVIGTGAIVPVASFTGSPTNGAGPLTVTFADASSGTITNRFWNFGDGATSNTTATSVLHVYGIAGTNTVSLTVTGPVGANTQTQTNNIVVINPAQLVVNPASLNFGSVTVGQTNSLSFSAINTGDAALSGTATSVAPFVVTSGSPYSVAGGQTQTVTVTFVPGSSGSFNGSVIFASNGGNSTNTVSGTGLTPGSISVTPASYDFGTLATGTTAQTSFTVTNSGGTAVTNGTATVSTPYTIVSGASFSVAGFGGTNVTVQFAPVGAGAFTNAVIFATANGGNATNTVTGAGAIVPVASFTGSPTNGAAPLTVTFTDTSSGTITNRAWSFGDGATSNTTATSVLHTYATAGTNTVSLTVTGPVGTNTQTQTNNVVVVNPAQLVVNPGSLSFGSVTIGQTNSLSFSVINTGDLSLSGTATGAAPFLVTSGSPYTVAGGQTQTVTVAFAPSSAGTFNGSVIFASNGGNSTNTVSGTGLTPGSISVTPATWDFGTLATGTTAQASFTVTNSGGTAVTNGTAAVNAPYTIVSGATFSVAGFGATNVVVQFAPVSAGGFTNSVVFTTANGGNATNTVTGAGAIVPVASFAASPTNGAAPLTVTFTDASSGTITNRAWNFGDGATSNTTATTVLHTYSTAATNTVSLTVTGPVGANTQTQTNYIMVVNPPQLVVNPGSLNFGSVTIGQTNSLNFLVINTGDLLLSGTATGAAPFAVTSGGSYNVAGRQTQTVTVAFAPGSNATFNGSVIFSSNGGVSTNAVSGIGLTPGQIGVSPVSLNFGTIATGSPTQGIFTVSNSGGTAVSNGTATVSAPYTIVSGATFSVAGFGATNVVVQFAPVSAGGFTNNVVFATANGGSSTNTVTGTGAIVPVASFTGSPTNGAAPLTVTFTDASSGTITNRFWNFGDGATSNTTATSVLHTYAAAVTNTVSLTVTGPVGTNTQTRTNYIVVLNPPQLVVNPGSLNYGSVTIGQTNSLNFSAINTGDLSLTGTVSAAGPFLVTSGSPYTVAARQTQTVTVAFAPSSSGTFNGSVIFSSNGGNSTNAASGVGLTAGQIGVSPVSLNFGTIATGSATQGIFTVSNSGGTAVSNGTASVNAPYTIVSGATFSVAGFGATNVVVQFAPVSAGGFTNSVFFSTANGGNSTNTVTGTGAIVPVASFTGSPTNGAAPLTVTFTDASSGTITNRAWSFGDGATSNTVATSVLHTYAAAVTNTVTLTVSGPVGTNTQTRINYIVVVNPPQLVVNPGSLNYGSVTIGQTNSLNFSVINTGDLLLSGTATGAAPFLITSGGSYNVAGRQTQTVSVAFAPSSSGTFNGSVIFSSNGGNSTNAVSGVGLTAGQIGVSPVSLNFGTIATGSATQGIFTVSNSGGTAVSNGTASVNAPYTIVSGATFSVAGFGATNVVVQFAPVSAGGFTNSVFFVTANGGNATNTVTGTGAIVPVASFTGSPTNGAAPLTVTFTDASSGTITNRFWNFGDGATSNTTATSVLHTYAAAVTNTVSLTVTGPVGTNTQTRINYIVVLNPPQLVVNPGSLSFGSVTIGQTNSLNFLVINTGDLLLSGTATGAAPFAITSGGSYNVAGRQTQTVTVAFAPGSNATFNGSVIFSSNGGVSTNAVSGTGLTPGSIAVTPSSLNFGLVTTGKTAQASLVVTNSGGTAVSNGTATVSAPYTIVSGATFSVSGFGATNVMVRFAPVSVGGFTNSVVFATANGGNVTNTVTGTGTVAPVAAYSFDEGTGTTVADASGHGNTGTISAATWTNAGRYGNALVFNGTSALVTIADAASLHLTTGMTLEAWVNLPTVSSAWRDVIYKYNDNYFLEATSIPFTAPAGGGVFGGAGAVTFGTAALALNTWAHLALTYDGATLRLYVNGVQVSSLAQTGNIQVSTSSLQLGGDTIKGQYFQGRIDEVRVYNVALTAAQIQSDMVTPIGSFPSAPGNLTATAVSGSQVNLGWTASTDNVGVAGYLVERQGPSSTNFVQMATTTGTSYNDLGLTANTNYSYRVRATNTVGHVGPYSNVAQAYTGLSISPRAAVLTFTQTQQFTASFGNGNVIWSVDGIAGGSASSGTITAVGLYSPPNSVGSHTVTATTLDQTLSTDATVYVSNYAGLFTYHNDNFRSGQNLGETVLAPTNVNSATFGKLFSYALDGMTFASPLYAANLNIPGKGFHNVVFVATEHDSVYAFDADGLTNSPLWQVSFINPAGGTNTVPAADTGETGDIPNEIGITGTPVIDPSNGTLYVVAKTREISGNTTNYVQKLHALDIATGTNKFGGPVVLQGSVTNSVGGQVSFVSLHENQRTGLLLANGVVYFGFSSHGDVLPYYGWLMGYNATNLQQVLLYNADPNTEKGGIWMNGDGVACDSTGTLYFITGDGILNTNTGDYGDCFLKISPAGAVLDYFSPSVQTSLDASNLDLGSGGVLLLPDQSGAHPHEMVSAGKNGTIYLVDRDNMGHYHSNTDQVVQSLVNIFANNLGQEGGNFSSPVYFNGRVYFSPVAGNVQAFQLTNGLLSTNPTSRSSVTYGGRGGTLAISANGSANGILWTLQNTGTITAGILHAYDSANLTNELYNSSQAGTRDTLDIWSKFSLPLVANGKVFVSSVSQLTVYGLLP